MGNQRVRVTPSVKPPATARPVPRTPAQEHELLRLQRMAGNRAVTQLLAQGVDGPGGDRRETGTIQRKPPKVLSKLLNLFKKKPKAKTSGKGVPTTTPEPMPVQPPVGTTETQDETSSVPEVQTPIGSTESPTTVPEPVLVGATNGPGTGSTAVSSPPTLDTSPTTVPETSVPETPPPSPTKSLLQQFTDALSTPPVTLGSVQSVYASATMGEREALWKDDTAMGKLKTALPKKDWVRVMADLGVYREGGTVAHTSAKVADDKIRDQFKDYVGEATKEGRSVVGQVLVLDGQDWLDAYYHEFPNELPRGGPTDTESRTNAFTTTKPPKNVIVLNKNKGNPGTSVHEGMHLYQHDGSMRLGSKFYEGLTEYLTRQITVPMGIPRTNYERNYKGTMDVIAAVGAEVLTKAYFDGDVSKVKAAFVAFRKGKGDTQEVAEPKWEALLLAFKGDDYNQVKTLCQ
jgi:hypothetical protein